MGRKKHIIVTNAGAKLHPLVLARRILACDGIRQAVVISDDQRGDVVAVMSVDNPHAPETIALVDRVVQQINESVPGYKRIGRTVLTRTRFSEDNGMLTRNLKPNRAAIARHFSTPETAAAAGA
jgi:long-subunit acyl-CoA synthetase (AMP-forming)